MEGVLGQPDQRPRAQLQGSKAGMLDPWAESNGDNRHLGGQREGHGVGKPSTPALAAS